MAYEYHKPEFETPEELGRSIGYNTWWQFEEGYKINQTNGDSVRSLSSVEPTDTSFATVVLEDSGNKISNKFIVSKTAEYVLEIFGTVNVRNFPNYDRRPTMNIYIDDVKRELQRGDSTECNLYKKQYFCSYNVTVQLEEGEHIISTEAAQRNVKVDKFRMYQPKEVEGSYNIEMTEFKKILPRENPSQIEMNIGIRKKMPIFGWVLISVVIFLLGYYNWRKELSNRR